MPCLILAAAAPCGTVVLPTGLGAETTAEPVYSLHPLLGDYSLFDVEVFPQLYRPLLWIAPDLTISAADSEASGIEVLGNDTLFRIHLKPWLWSDGVLVTADGLQFCFELIRQLGPAFFGWNSDGMPDLFSSVPAVAPDVLEIRTPRPVNPDWFETLAIAGVFCARLSPTPSTSRRSSTSSSAARRPRPTARCRPPDTGYLSPAAAVGRFSVGYDPAQARELLREAGYAPGPDDVLQKDGVRLAMTQLVGANLPDVLLIADFVQAGRARIGIQMQLRQMDFSQLLALAYRSLLGWETSAIGVSNPAYPHLGAEFGSTAPQNLGPFADPVSDALLTRITTEPGRQALFAAQDRIPEQVPLLFLPEGFYDILTADGVTGWQIALQSNFLWRLEYLHLTGDRACNKTGYWA